MNELSRNEISVLFQQIPDWKLTQREARLIIQNTVTQVLTAEHVVVPVEVSVVVTNDDGIRELNRSYHHSDAPTDVLAFHQLDAHINRTDAQNYRDRILLGDVVISADAVSRQASRYCWPEQKELSLLVAHGTLHLLGYDDKKKETARKMKRKQLAVLDSLKFDGKKRLRGSAR